MASDYSVLGLSDDESEDEVTKKYRRLAMKYHPDRNNGTTTEKFIEIKSAYERIIGGEPIREVKKKEYTHNYDDSVKRAIINIEQRSVKICVKILLSANYFADGYEICVEVQRRFNNENMYLRDKELITFAYKCYLDEDSHIILRSTAGFLKGAFKKVFRKA